MSDLATHCLCPRCNSYQPMIWEWTKTGKMTLDGRIGPTFEGGKVRCRTCQFEATQIGTVINGAVK